MYVPSTFPATYAYVKCQSIGPVSIYEAASSAGNEEHGDMQEGSWRKCEPVKPNFKKGRSGVGSKSRLGWGGQGRGAAPRMEGAFPAV